MPTFRRPASCLIAILISASAFATQVEGTLEPETPRSEFLTNPLGIDVAKLYEKWIRDMADDQESDGRLSPIIPGSGWGKEAGGGCMDPLWTGVTVFMPWHLYQR